jgi:hypothetical protein
MPPSSTTFEAVRKAYDLRRVNDGARQSGCNCGYLALLNLYPDEFVGMSAYNVRMLIVGAAAFQIDMLADAFKLPHLTKYYPQPGDGPVDLGRYQQFEQHKGVLTERTRTLRRMEKSGTATPEAIAELRRGVADANRQAVRGCLEIVHRDYLSNTKWLDEIGIKIIVLVRGLDVLVSKCTNTDWANFSPTDPRDNIGVALNGRRAIDEKLDLRPGVMKNSGNLHWVAYVKPELAARVPPARLGVEVKRPRRAGVDYDPGAHCDDDGLYVSGEEGAESEDEEEEEEEEAREVKRPKQSACGGEKKEDKEEKKEKKEKQEQEEKQEKQEKQEKAEDRDMDTVLREDYGVRWKTVHQLSLVAMWPFERIGVEALAQYLNKQGVISVELACLTGDDRVVTFERSRYSGNMNITTRTPAPCDDDDDDEDEDAM